MFVQDHRTLDQLKQLERAEKNADRARRLRIVILAAEGWTAPSIAMCIGFSRRICQRWVARYNEHGLEGLDDRRGPQSGVPLSDEQEAGFRQRIAAGPTQADSVCSLRSQDFQRILAEEFDMVRSLSSVYWLLHRLPHWLGYSYLKPRPRHRKADPARVEEFKRQWPTTLAEIGRKHPDKPLRVYFQDESRFGQQGTNTQVWAQSGSRPGTHANHLRRPLPQKRYFKLERVLPQLGSLIRVIAASF
ncbi:MAG: IS630 family transposase [Planctomycetaceae bacterium]